MNEEISFEPEILWFKRVVLVIGGVWLAWQLGIFDFAAHWLMNTAFHAVHLPELP